VTTLPATDDALVLGPPGQEPPVPVGKRPRWWRRPRVRLWALLVTSLVLVAGAFIEITDGGAFDIGVGVCGVAFFGLGAVLFALALRPEKPQDVPVPALLPDEVHGDEWFEDDVPESDDLTEAQATFLAALRERARSLPAGSVYSSMVHDEEVLTAAIAISDGRIILEFGVEVSGRTLRGGRFVGGQLADDGRRAFELTGSSDELAEAAVEWFERLIRRPLNRLEWWHKGRCYAIRYVFADTGTALLEGFAADRAPRGIRVAAGVGEPAAYAAVRIGGRALNPPFGWLAFDWRPL
jgi:hypothetical protein